MSVHSEVMNELERAAGMKSITVTLPIRAVSITNMREHWARRSRRAKQQRMAALAIPGLDASWLPCVVTLTRIAPRELDDDNIRSACKSLRDGVADRLGIDDRDPRVRWEYGQERGGVREYAVRVEIRTEERDAA